MAVLMYEYYNMDNCLKRKNQPTNELNNNPPLVRSHNYLDDRDQNGWGQKTSKKKGGNIRGLYYILLCIVELPPSSLYFRLYIAIGTSYTGLVHVIKGLESGPLVAR